LRSLIFENDLGNQVYLSYKKLAMKFSPAARFCAIVLLMAIPSIAHADPDFSGLETVIFMFIGVVVVMAVISIITAIRYYNRGNMVAFYVALVLGLIQYAAFGMVRALGPSSPVSLLAMMPLVPLALLCMRSINQRSTVILPYAGMNLIVVSACSICLMSIIELLGSFTAIEVLSQCIGVISAGFFSWLLTKRLLESGKEMPDSTVFVKGNLFVLLSFGISLASSILSLRMSMTRGLGFILSSDLLLKWVLPIFLVANLVVWLTIIFFRTRRSDQTDEPLV
jgi:hypothetical protein